MTLALGRLEESGIVTRCEITTYEPDMLMELAFDDETRVQKLIMKVRRRSFALSTASIAYHSHLTVRMAS